MDRSLIEGIWIERICLFFFIFDFFFFKFSFNYFYGFSFFLFLFYLEFIFFLLPFLLILLKLRKRERKKGSSLERVQESDNLITLGFVQEFSIFSVFFSWVKNLLLKYTELNVTSFCRFF